MERDAEATAAAAEVMLRLRRPVPRHATLFPTVFDWAAGLSELRTAFDGETGPFPAGLVDRAERLFAELLASQEAPIFLHGDLHHGNILSAGERGWLAIDPKGVIGEPAYEVGALLRNPMPHIPHAPDLTRLQARRIDMLSEMLGLDRERVRGWGIAQAVLSAWWSWEGEGGGWEPWLVSARHLIATGT